jgi:hypothetical protein
LCSRTTDLPLFTIPAGQLSSHKSIPEETQEEESYDKYKDNPRKFLNQEQYACENGDHEYQKIWDNILPCDLFLIELFRLAPGKKQGAQIAFTKSTGFTVIKTVHTMPAQKAEFKEKNKE